MEEPYYLIVLFDNEYEITYNTIAKNEHRLVSFLANYNNDRFNVMAIHKISGESKPTKFFVKEFPINFEHGKKENKK